MSDVMTSILTDASVRDGATVEQKFLSSTVTTQGAWFD